MAIVRHANLSLKHTLRRSGAPAHVRGVYLWAGEATIALQRVKFPDRGVDVPAHLRAHTREAAEELAEQGVSLAFLSMNWGFPPEQERAHWRAFSEALRVYNQCGISVIGYVQASNCLAAGSYAANGWYARDPAGRRISYFQNRLMTCWSDPNWAEEVQRHAERVLSYGAQGVFFDNIWMGATPWIAGGDVGGFAGCSCSRCAGELGDAVPIHLHKSKDARRYLSWRAERVRARVSEWATNVREHTPDAVVLLNNCDIILRDTRSLFGLDPQQLAPLEDALLIENVAVPRWEAGRLVTNALTIKAVRALIPDKQILTVTYQHGIGLDGPPDARVMRRTLAEAAALGAGSVLKGSEYLDGEGRFTVITAPALARARAAAGVMFNWLEGHAFLYENAVPDPDVLVLLDEQALRERWSDTAPGLAATALAVQASRVSYAFVTRADLRANGALLPVLVPPGVRVDDLAGIPTISLPDLDVPAASSQMMRSAAFRSAAHPVMSSVARNYFGNARFRRTLDGLGVTRRFLQSPLFQIPRQSAAVPRALRDRVRPAIALRPVLVDRWRTADGRRLIHLVNYADGLNRTFVPLETNKVHVHTPDESGFSVGADGVTVDLDVYAVLEVEG